MKKTTAEKIEMLKEYAKQYELYGTSPVDDDTYDTLYAEAQAEDPDNSFFDTVGGDLENAEYIYGTKVAHKYIMGSLLKDPNPDKFGEFLQHMFGNDIDKIVALLQLKVDGSSFCLKFQDGKFIQGVSRGDGITGIDYSKNAVYIRGVKEKIKAKGYVEIKGEVYKNRHDFVSQGWCDDYANSRNFTSGAINQKSPEITKERGLDFIAYEVRGDIKFETEEEKNEFLVDNGFETLEKYTTKINCKNKSIADIVAEIKKFMDGIDREKLPFDVDGVVWKINDIKWAESFGTTDGGKRPKANRAVKFPTEKKETILEGIEWSIGRIGTLTPVGLLKPVELAGTTVSRVSLHNLDEMKRLGITKLGCTVVVAKQGDIIPKILEMTKAGTKPLDIPDTCPSCDSELEYDSDEDVTKICTNEACPAQLNRRIEHWFKKIDVNGIGPGIVRDLITTDDENGIVIKCLADMYTKLEPNRDEWSILFGKTAFSNIVDAVNSVREMTLAKFIEALGIGKIGRMSADIVAVAPTIADVDDLEVEDIVLIPGFKEKKASSFVNGWKKQRDEIEILLKHIKIKEVEVKKAKASGITGKKFLITGTLSVGRKEFEAKIVENGGLVASSVSKNLDYLIVGDEPGSKVDKAEKLGIPRISEDDFNGML